METDSDCTMSIACPALLPNASLDVFSVPRQTVDPTFFRRRSLAAGPSSQSTPHAGSLYATS